MYIDIYIDFISDILCRRVHMKPKWYYGLHTYSIWVESISGISGISGNVKPLLLSVPFLDGTVLCII